MLSFCCYYVIASLREAIPSFIQEIAPLGLDPEKAQGVTLRYSTFARNDK